MPKKAVTAVRYTHTVWQPVCVQEGGRRNGCTISKLAWRASKFKPDRVWKVRHVPDGSVEVTCFARSSGHG